RAAVMIAQLVVEPPLRRIEFAVNRLLAAIRQFGRDLPLRPAEDERAHGAREQRDFFPVQSAASAPESTECAGRSEDAGIQELEQAPQLADVVLDGRAAQREPVVRL